MESDAEIARKCEARVGARLGAWRLERLLGVGGMAAVYRALDADGRPSAIKLLHTRFAASPGIRARFQREAYIANKIAHPGIVRILADGVSEDGAPYLVMDLLEGDSVDSLLARGGRLTVRASMQIGAGVLEVLEKAHSLGILHRDLKPENLFVTRDGQVKVLDFGIARLFEKQSGEDLTRTGMVLGTPAFMAPEQALGRWSQVDVRTDIWSVGAILFLLVSGRVPHGSATGNEMLIRAATQPAPSLARVVDAPLPVIRLVDRALAYDKKRRFPDATAMLQEVRRVVAELGDSQAVQRPIVGSKPPPSMFDAPTLAPEAVSPVPSSAPMSPTKIAQRLEADSIVDDRFADSIAKAYREAAKTGSTAVVTNTVRAAVRRLAANAPDSALSFASSLCLALVDREEPARSGPVVRDFANAIISARTLRALLTGTLRPDVDVAECAQRLPALLDALGDAHAGVALEVLPAMPDGPVKEILLDYVAKNGSGFEAQLGALFPEAEPEMALVLVGVLARMTTAEARDALAMAMDSPHESVRERALGELRASIPPRRAAPPAPKKS
jgi:serine/threonine-protein kinase